MTNIVRKACLDCRDVSRTSEFKPLYLYSGALSYLLSFCLMFRKPGFILLSSPGFSLHSFQRYKGPGSLVLYVTPRMFISLTRGEGVGPAVKNFDLCLCVLTPMVCQCEVKRVARVVKACCLLMSRPVEWMRTQMGFLSGGLFFRPTLSVFEEMGKPKLRMARHPVEWGKTSAFSLDGVNRGGGTAVKVKVFVRIRSVCHLCRPMFSSWRTWGRKHSLHNKDPLPSLQHYSHV